MQFDLNKKIKSRQKNQIFLNSNFGLRVGCTGSIDSN